MIYEDHQYRAGSEWFKATTPEVLAYIDKVARV